jgi:hypothetical protein
MRKNKSVFKNCSTIWQVDLVLWDCLRDNTFRHYNFVKSDKSFDVTKHSIQEIIFYWLDEKNMSNSGSVKVVENYDTETVTIEVL